MEEAARMADDPTLFAKGAASVAALFGAAKKPAAPHAAAGQGLCGGHLQAPRGRAQRAQEEDATGARACFCGWC
eukprot:11584465-Alexandrium_andersonii.AAC.1